MHDTNSGQLRKSLQKTDKELIFCQIDLVSGKVVSVEYLKDI